ncbi:hypothetical protein DRO32_03880, partial [Candidatus Bathyarchaeota archaeon]
MEVGLRKVIEGDIDLFMWSMPWTVYEGLSDEELEKLLLVKCSTGVWFIEPNWAGAIEPNLHPWSPVLNETNYPGIVIVSGGEGEPY